MFFIGKATLALSMQELIFIPLIIVVFILIVFFGNIVLKISTGVDYLTRRQTDFNERLRKLNKTNFLSKGFRFEAGEMGAWIELQFMKEYKELGRHHRELEKKVEEEINDELLNEMYLSGIMPCKGKSWDDF